MNELRLSYKAADQSRLVSMLEAALVTLIWSSTFVIVKIGLDQLGPLTIAGLRYFLGSLVLLPFLFIRRAKIFPISSNLWLRLALIGVSSYTLGNGALFWGLKYLPATTGSFLMSMIPLLVLIGGALLLREVPTRWQVFGVILCLLGSGLFFSGGLLPGEPRGILIMSVGLIGFMAFSLLGRGIARDRQLNTLTLTTLPLVIGGLISLILAITVEGLPSFSGNSLFLVLWLALVNTSLGYLLYNHALRDLTALEMNMIMNLSPLFTALLSWIILKEQLSVIQIIGMVIVIIGVILVQLFSKSSSPKDLFPGYHPRGKKILSTSRLDIIPLTRGELSMYLDQEESFSWEVGPTSRVILTDILRRAIVMKLSKLSDTPWDQHPWITYWLIWMKSERFGVGFLGFKGVPSEHGEVEIGYGIDPKFQNKGIMTEAAKALIEWAFQDNRCIRITAPNTRKDNLASNRVLAKLGMRVFQESEDTLSWCLDKFPEKTSP